MAVHGELRPDDSALPLLVASAALSKADSAMTRPTGSVRIDNGDGTETWLGEAASETGGVIQWVNDTTPPARPIGVTATCQMGVVVAAWAGELEEPIPADFSHVEVFAQKDGSADVVDAGMLYGAGSVTLTGFAEGDLVDVWAVAYDDAHDESGVSKPNASGKSDIATVVVEPVVSQQQLAAKADEILKAGKAYSDQLNSQIQTDMSTAKKSIDSNTDAVKAAQKAADDAKASIVQTASKVTSIDSSLASTQSKVNSIDSSLSSVKDTLDSTVSKVSAQGSVLDKANASITALQKTADGKNTIYIQETEPAHTALRPGDLWYLRSNYRTYWQGEPNASPSVMEIPSSRIRGIKIWDGSTFNDYVFVADKIVAENSVTTGLLAADAIYGKVLKGGEFITTNGRLKINDAGLVATDANGNPTLAVDAGTGSVSMLGALKSGSTVSGAAITGGTVDANEYQLHSGSTLVGKANSSGVYFGDALTYAKSGSTWKLSLKNAGLQASTVDGCTVTGGTVTGATVQTTSTANRGVKITSGGLAAYDTNGNATLAVDASTGSVSMLGALKSGSTVSGATITGGTVDANEYQLHSGSELVGKANANGVYFGDSLTYAKSGSTWKLSLKNAGLQASTVDGCTVTGGTIQTTSAWNRGVKITSGGLAAYDSNGAATLTVDANSGSILMKGAVSTNSTLNAPAINSGTVTGAVIQTTAAANRGVKLTGSALQAWDDNGNQTLDLNGSTNTMTGIFRTAASGNRIEISNTTFEDDSSIAKITGHDKYGNVNWLIEGDIGGAGIYGNGKNPHDPLDTSTLHLGVSEQNPEINITGWGNGYRQISMGADRVDFTSSSVSDKTHVPDSGIYINGLRIDPYYVTDISKILTFENSDWSEYKGAGGNDPRTRLLIVGNLRFLTLELQCKHNIGLRWCAGTILSEHMPANGINAAAAMAGGGVGDAFIIGRNVDSGTTDSHGNAVKAGQIYIDPVSDYVNKSNWFCATFIYQV